MNPYVKKFKQDGLAETLRHALTRLLRKLKLINDTSSIRRRLSEDLLKLHGGRVAYGPLKGFRFSSLSRWSTYDRGAMVLGLYEQEILTLLAAESAGRAIFVDIGAADGYYSIGMVSQGLFEKSYSFERSPRGQKVIRDTAAINGVSDKTLIFGTATPESIKASIPTEDLANAVVLVDIEGAEFDVLSAEMLALFRNCVLVVELHEWFFDDGDARRAALEERARAHFDMEVLKTTARDLSPFSELVRYADDERWLLCSEGRAQPMEWLCLRPKQGAA